MNKLFTKLDSYVDYNNSYSMNKALTTLHNEFKLAVSHNNVQYAKVVVNATQCIYDKLRSMYRESEDLGETMSYMQKRMAKKMSRFISYLTDGLRKSFGISHRGADIETAINIH